VVADQQTIKSLLIITIGFLTTKIRIKMAISPTQRTLKRLREKEEYPLVTIVERWNAFAKIRQDLFGIIDILAIDTKGNTVGLQVTSYSNISARVKKMENSDAISHLRDANWVLLVEGWHKKDNKWVSRIVDIS
jgi:hypothetical protein|tara:strand:+ start:2636 stop:3037 length:402 start_codon:yes stop_codon:yes gene_type:complete